MKTILICSIISLLACLNQTDTNKSDHIILHEIEPKEILSPDTFIPVTEKKLNIDVNKDVQILDSNTSSKPISDAVEKIKTENKSTDLAEPAIAKTSEVDEISDDPKVLSAEQNHKVAATNSSEKNYGDLLEDEIQQPSTEISPINKTPKEEHILTKDKDVSSEKLLTPVEVIVSKADHSGFSDLLFSFVASNGDVNYKGFKSSEAKLDSYLRELDEHTPNADWSNNEQLAYWMNAYNAFTIKLILQNYPVAKITDLHGGKPWDVKWIKLGAKTYSLNNIEHDIIRPKYNDPRIHFAVNCAAKSCPPLLNQAYTGENVNTLLNTVTKSFVNSDSNQLSSNSIQLSKIFEWYGEDFGDIIKFLNQYSAKKIDSNAKIGYLDYNWSLNEG